MVVIPYEYDVFARLPVERVFDGESGTAVVVRHGNDIRDITARLARSITRRITSMSLH